MIYYMVTGINAGGHLVNAGQTITRAEALRLYTASNAGSSGKKKRSAPSRPAN